MKRFKVQLSQDASLQLAELRRYIEADSGKARVDSYVDAIVDFCDGLDVFPQRGTRREDILPGLRVVGFRRRATIAFTVEAETVTILGVYYGGQDYEATLRTEIE